MSRNRHENRQDGFTLVELAVVIIVIGLLIGGIFLGLNLVNHSRLLSTGARAEIFRAALDEFTSRYAALPGDMADATAKLPACTGGCGNGNGNGVVGAANADIFAAAGAGGEDRENAQFWYHLQAADLIHGISMNTAIAASTTWGQAHPAAPAGGGYVIRSMGGQFAGAGGTPMTGMFLRWQGGSPYDAATAAFVAAPRDAQTIDLKFDDGNPLAGSVQARGTNAALTANDGCRAGISTYIETGGSLSCYMYFRIRSAAGL